MSKVLDNLKYSSSHEWVKLEGNVAVIGISDYAQDSLGSIVYLEVNEVGEVISKEDEFGVVESVKAASDLISPLSGKIIEVNQEVIDSPELLNEDPYGHWIMKLEVSNMNELDELLDANGYKEETK